MKKYSIKLEVDLDVYAFDQDDARDYISDIFRVDDEIKSIKIIKIEEK